MIWLVKTGFWLLLTVLALLSALFTLGIMAFIAVMFFNILLT